MNILAPVVQQQPLDQLRPGDHACLLYTTQDEKLSTLGSLLAQALSNQRQVLCVLEPQTRGRVLSVLRAQGAQPRAAMARGQLILPEDPQAYHALSALAKGAMLRQVRRAARAAREQGYSALLLVNELDAVLRDPDRAQHLLASEQRVTEVIRQTSCLALCLYGRRRSPERLLQQVLRAHSLILSGGQLRQGPGDGQKAPAGSRELAAPPARPSAPRPAPPGDAAPRPWQGGAGQLWSHRAGTLRLRGQLAGGIGHWVDQSLAQLQEVARAMQAGPAQGRSAEPPGVQRALGQATDRLAQLADLCNHLQLLSREARRSSCHGVDLNLIVGSALQTLQLQTAARGCTISARLDPGLPCVQANPFTLEEVLLYLLQNAVDCLAVPGAAAGEPRIALSTRLSAAGDQVRLSVADNGPGIDPAALPHVFEPGYTSRDPALHGGLGLPLARALVEGMQGTLRLRTVCGRGTTALVSLPAVSYVS